jgi:hypothetical protein
VATTPKKPSSDKKEPIIVRKDNTFQSFADGTSRIYRKDLPALIDKTDKLISWLVANGYKAKDIDIVGEKPASWDKAFGIEVVPAETPIAEKLSEVLNTPA